MDVITYVSNLESFRREARKLAQSGIVKDLSYNEQTDTLIYSVDKTPVYYQGNESVTLIRVENDQDLEHFEYMERLGECIDDEYMFDNENSKMKYESVVNTIPYTVDIDGELITVVPSYEIGVFA